MPTTQWEYQILEVNPEFGPKKQLEILKINGSEELAVTRREKSFLGEIHYRNELYQYLTDVGLQGWEVVGMSPIKEYVPDLFRFIVILKRSIVSDQDTFK